MGPANPPCEKKAGQISARMKSTGLHHVGFRQASATTRLFAYQVALPRAGQQFPSSLEGAGKAKKRTTHASNATGHIPPVFVYVLVLLCLYVVNTTKVLGTERRLQAA